MSGPAWPAALRDSGGGHALFGRDLDLAVELVNTHWVLARPPDRLTDIAVYQRILRDAGEDALADQLGLRWVRRARAPWSAPSGDGNGRTPACATPQPW
jgi:hypothetical protein